MARSYSAGMTLRFARSPEAPKRTMLHGSATPPYTELERLASAVIFFPRELLPVQIGKATSQTIPQPRIFQAPNATAQRSDDGWCSSLGAADFPGSAAGHR